MKRCIAAILAGITLLAIPASASATATASAAPINECGNPGRMGPNRLVVKNVTTSNLACQKGRALARTYANYGWLPLYIHTTERVSVRGCTTITDVRGVGGEYRNGRTVTFVVHFQVYGRACD